ncbi:P-loop containing nucleoside triphosphate hydrolase protein [Cristinia sonorae]|uniref:P-loop containing nucleoside triphosphate hydrolase protein n=1 Tax=Cristinia sonorae TaxID=1940300 RepID=A0A8K0UKB7_9AGAR|nr:P-loop containing nucleoside triphosphate hydrolase protein [Cristinia sonorae]
MSESNDSLLIAVMGATGAGKSTFINLASGSQLKVGYGLESCTSDVEVSTSLVLNGRLVTLIDTPGFDDTVKSEAEILRLIADFLAATYEGGRKLNGVIFIHRISDYRMSGVARKNFRLFRKLCGDDALKNVVIATNMWGDVTEEVGAAREKELAESELFFKPALEKGSKMLRHDNTADSAKRIIQEFVGTVPEVLSIQREVVDEKKTVAETTAGMDLQAELEKQLSRHKEELEGIKREMAGLMEEKDMAHHEEIKELTDALNEVRSQLAKFEQEQQVLLQAREADKEAADERARRLAREMEEREATLEALRQQARMQEAKINGLHESLADVEQRARDYELQKKAMDEQLQAQQTAHQAELERVRMELEARRRNERRLERPTPVPPKSPWDLLREATLGPEPLPPRRGGFFADIAFIVDKLLVSRPSRS